MVIAALPPPDSCDGKLAADEIHVMCSRRLISPDGHWQIVFKSDSEAAPAIHLNRRLHDDEAAVADRSGHVITHFYMERDARVHWLKDGQHLIVNYYAGSGETLPWVISLKPPGNPPVDLSGRVFPDLLRRAGIKDNRRFEDNRWIYHYYVSYLKDRGDTLTVSAEAWYTPYGRNGPATVKCYVYTLDKATFRHVRFVREVGWLGEDLPCPPNTDEKAN